MSSSKLPVVDSVAPVFGRINDADSHEMIPAHMWGEAFGERSAEFARVLRPAGSGNEFVTDTKGDDSPIDETLWRRKGTSAPGAIDPARRLEVMDAMGVDRMVVFGSGPGQLGLLFVSAPHETLVRHLSPRFDVPPDDFPRYGRGMVREHNDWCVRIAATSPRMYPAAVLLTHDIEVAVAEAEQLIGTGIRGVVIPSVVPPGGVSPAHPDIDPLWQLLAETNTTVYLHAGGEWGFAASEVEWRNAPSFTAVAHSDEISLEAFSFSVFHFGPQNFLSAMILGGVFDRHPTLRVGAIEYGAHWIGPMSDNLQAWYDHFGRKNAAKLQLPVRDYLERNVRCSLFFFEDVDKYIDRYGLDTVYCYASDYPHLEGGTDPVERISSKLVPYGDDVLEKVFVTNAELLLPA